MNGPPGPPGAPERPEEAPEAGELAPWEELDLTEAAQRWRRKAEELHRLSKRHEQLAHEYRQRAHHAEAMSRYLSGTGEWPKPP